MREDMEQKSNDHHPGRWHWRDGDRETRTDSLQLSNPSPVTSSLLLLCCCCSRTGWCVQSWQKLNRAHNSSSRDFLLSHQFVGTYFWPQIDAFGRLPKSEEIKFDVITSSSGYKRQVRVSCVCVAAPTVVQSKLKFAIRGCTARLRKWRNVIGPQVGWTWPGDFNAFPEGEQLFRKQRDGQRKVYFTWCNEKAIMDDNSIQSLIHLSVFSDLLMWFNGFKDVQNQ